MLRLLPFLLLLSWYNGYSQTHEYARSVVSTLASDEFMGRGFTGKADFKAAEYIRSEFIRLGVQSIDDTYFQSFDISVNTFPGKMGLNVNSIAMKPGIDYIVDPSSPSLRGKFLVTRISRRELADENRLQKILETVRGKAVLIDLNDTSRYSPKEEAEINRIINTIKYDPGISNPLTILFSDKKLTWSISDRQASKAVLVMNSTGIDPHAITEVQVDIKARLKTNYKTQNVIGIIRGKTVPDSFLILTAHYDHLGMMGKNTIFPGANDNASGVAMLLSLADYFAANPPEYSIVFIAFSAEELGLLGAGHFVENPLFKTENTRFLVNFDLAGTGDDGIKVVNATIFKKEFELLQEINKEYNYLSSVQPRGEACISDHCLFYMKRIPCFYIYTLGGISAYHDVYDRAETLPLTDFEDYYKLMYTFLREL